MKTSQLIYSKDAEALFRELKLANFTGAEKEEVLEALIAHFQKVILEVVVLSLDADEIEKFKAALESDDAEEKITALCARIPGLAEKIEDAVGKEFQVIKAANEVV